MNAANIFSQRNIISTAVCLSLMLVIVCTIQGLQTLFISRSTGGYDYNFIRRKGYDWTGPDAGQIISLNYLKNKDEIPLSEKFDSQLILITVLDPECGACRAAGDQINYLERQIKSLDFGYAVVSFSRKLSHKELSLFLTTQNIFTEPFLWTDETGNILPSIKKMVLPTHILIDKQGRVIKTFPGTSNERAIRERMTNQILEEIRSETIKLHSH